MLHQTQLIGHAARLLYYYYYVHNYGDRPARVTRYCTCSLCHVGVGYVVVTLAAAAAGNNWWEYSLAEHGVYNRPCVSIMDRYYVYK